MKYFLSVLILTILDQMSKAFLLGKGQTSFNIKLLPFLNLVSVWNQGVSFGIFGYYSYSNYIFLILNSCILTYLINLFLQLKSKGSLCGLTFVISGALGNLIDRVIRKAVFDFIYFNYKTISFPVFNFADAFITLGGVIFIYDQYLVSKKRKL